MTINIKLKYTKKSEARQNWGRGADQCYDPAEWWVIGNGKKMGYIHALTSIRYMESPTYQFVFVAEGKPDDITVLGNAPFRTTSTLRDMKKMLADTDRWVMRWIDYYGCAQKRQQQETK